MACVIQLASRIRTELRPDPARKLSANLYDIYLLLCVQWKTADDGQRNCPKHVEFYSKNKFQKLVYLVSFIIRIYHDAGSPERQLKNEWRYTSTPPLTFTACTGKNYFFLLYLYEEVNITRLGRVFFLLEIGLKRARWSKVWRAWRHNGNWWRAACRPPTLINITKYFVAWLSALLLLTRHPPHSPCEGTRRQPLTLNTRNTPSC